MVTLTLLSFKKNLFQAPVLINHDVLLLFCTSSLEPEELQSCSLYHMCSCVFLSLLLFCMLPGDWLPCGQHQWAAPRWPRGLHSASSPQVITRALGRREGMAHGPCFVGSPGQVHRDELTVLLPHPPTHLPAYPSIHPSNHHSLHLPIHTSLCLSIHPFYLLCTRHCSKYWGIQ